MSEEGRVGDRKETVRALFILLSETLGSSIVLKPWGRGPLASASDRSSAAALASASLLIVYFIVFFGLFGIVLFFVFVRIIIG